MTTSTTYIENPVDPMTNSSLDPVADPSGNPAAHPGATFAADPMAREAFRPAADGPGPRNGFDRSKNMGSSPSPLGGAAQMLQNVLKNKIMVGLILVFIFIFTVGQFYTSNESNNAAQRAATTPVPLTSGRYPQQANSPRPTAAQAPTPRAMPANGLTPVLAQQFVFWWISKAMDYQAVSATASHNEAFQWMTPQAVKAFKESLWSPQIAAGITQGQVSAAFQPISVQSQAINPDGSIVVSVAGTLVIQEANNPSPASQQIIVDFLVRKEKGGCRIAGLYNRTTR